MLLHMKHTFFGLVFILGCATGSVAAQLVVPPARAETPPARWEYFCGEGTASTKQFNTFGAQGWELATMTTTPPRAFAGVETLFCFKRRIDS